jgi:hypothetical protein
MYVPAPQVLCARVRPVRLKLCQQGKAVPEIRNDRRHNYLSDGGRNSHPS